MVTTKHVYIKNLQMTITEKLFFFFLIGTAPLLTSFGMWELTCPLGHFFPGQFTPFTHLLSALMWCICTC